MHDTLTSSACACAQAEAFAETLGTLPRLTAAQPAHAVVIARDAFVIGTDAQRCEFEVVLTRPAVSLHDAAMLQARSSVMLCLKHSRRPRQVLALLPLWLARRCPESVLKHEKARVWA